MDQSLAWTLLPLFLLGMTNSSHSSLVKVNKGLKVKQGQSAYLRDGDLQFHIPRQKDVCKVEVVLNEPITQRVGKFIPKVMEKPSSNEKNLSPRQFSVMVTILRDSIMFPLECQYQSGLNSIAVAILQCMR